MSEVRDRLDDAVFFGLSLIWVIALLVYAWHNSIEKTLGEYRFIYYMLIWLGGVIATYWFYWCCKLGATKIVLHRMAKKRSNSQKSKVAVEEGVEGKL